MHLDVQHTDGDKTWQQDGKPREQASQNMILGVAGQIQILLPYGVSK